EATCVLEALAKVQTQRPAVVLLDVNMPEPNGLEVCSRLHALDSTNSVPIIMITARDEQAVIDEAFASSASDYITKPIYWPVLRQRLKRLLLTTHAMQELDNHGSHLEEVVAARTVELSATNAALQQEIVAR